MNTINFPFLNGLGSANETYHRRQIQTSNPAVRSTLWQVGFNNSMSETWLWRALISEAETTVVTGGHWSSYARLYTHNRPLVGLLPSSKSAYQLAAGFQGTPSEHRLAITALQNEYGTPRRELRVFLIDASQF